MTQLCSTASTHEASWKMWLFKVFCVICFIAVCAAQDGTDDVSRPHNTLTGTTTVSYDESPTPIAQLMSAWLDVFPNERVKFNCSIEGSPSEWNFTWYKFDEDVPRDSMSGDGSVLTIPAVTQSHAGNYSCQGQHKTKGLSSESEGLNLEVYDKIPKPTVSKSPDFSPMYIGETVSLTCTVDVASAWKYQWYKDGQKLPDTSEVIRMTLELGHKGKYSCKASRGEITTVNSDQTQLDVLSPPTPTLKLRSPWQHVFIDEPVEFTCEVDSPTVGWTFTWYNNRKGLSGDTGVSLKGDGSSIQIIKASKTYEGQYSCKAHLSSRGVNSGNSNAAEIRVYDEIPKPVLNKAPDFNPMYVGEKVIFTCTVRVTSGWNYQWYRDEEKLLETSNTLHITLKPGDKGNYFCKATRGETTTTEVSDKKLQEVHEIPVPSLEKATQWLDVFLTETVRFRCHIQGSSGWTYKWLKDDSPNWQAYGSTVSFDSNRATLSINSASTTHRGQYKCQGQLQDRNVNTSSSSSLTLEVYDTKPTVIMSQNPDYKVMFSGEFVTFSCHINVSSGWEYQWIKDGVPLAESSNKDYSKAVQTTNTGSYTCQIKRGSNPSFVISSSSKELVVKGEKPKPILIQKPSVENMYVGESVTFDCKVEISTGWNYRWYKDGISFLNDSSHFKMDSAGLSDSGKYKCEAVRSPTNFKTELSDERHLNILEIPVPTLQKAETQWLDVFPTESAKLHCRMPNSSDWSYTWFKDLKKIQPDKTVSFDTIGSTLTINAASAEHRGQYTCSALLKSRNVNSSSSSELTLSVYDTKPTVTVQQTPEYSLMHTGDSVSFRCHINVSSGWEYMWHKDGKPFTAVNNTHTISSVHTSSSGSYTCQVKRGLNAVFMSDQSQAAVLDVQERPKAGIVLLTGWSEVFSTDSLILKCEVMQSEDKWNYTWFKANDAISQSTTAQHTVTPQNDPDQSLYTCKGVRNGRPSYSKTSDHFRTKNLLLKRRVLLSISGCIFFGIIAVFIGCVVLKITRKPGDDDLKPDEDNLFLTMAQQKGCDVPCPLVEYITDASLNAPLKEGDENGTVCSEATPLPITPQEDQAVSTDNQDAAENSGLMSFKQ